MPIFESHNTIKFGRKGNMRLYFRVEVGLVGLGGILHNLKALLRTNTSPTKPTMPMLSVDEKPAEEASGNHSFSFRRGTHDETVFQSVNVHNEYRLPDTFQADDIVVDIGAHIGSFCYAALQRGSNHVHGFEPEKENYELAVRNLRPFGDRVHLCNKAVWRSDRKGDKLSFTMSPDEANTAGGSVVFANAGEEVETVAFDDMILEVTNGGKKRVKMLKIDCEGSEFPILLTSRLLHLIDNIYGEYHEFGGEYDARTLSESTKVNSDHHKFGGEYAALSVSESMKVPGFERFTIQELTEALQRAGFSVTSARHGQSSLGLFFATRQPQTVDSEEPLNHPTTTDCTRITRL